MGSRVISFRVPEDIYKEFDDKCRDEGVNMATKLREYVESVCHIPTSEDTGEKPRVKVIHVDDELAEKVIGVDKKKSWFPLDFSPLFGKDK